ncbi:MAG: type IV pilin protein [Sulfuricellaceae bacterium]|nr:type IV pilin protein [Sulfuricellaceae bacterium]
MKRKSSGFTLIELMIVVAVIGILSVIAYPAYNNYVARGKVTEAHSLLSDYNARLEQYYQDNRNYGTAGGACGATLPTSKYFTFSCTAGSPAQTYAATAQSIIGQGLGNAAGDYTYTIDQTLAKATTKFKGATVSKNCWLVKGDEC